MPGSLALGCAACAASLLKLRGLPIWLPIRGPSPGNGRVKGVGQCLSNSFSAILATHCPLHGCPSVPGAFFCTMERQTWGYFPWCLKGCRGAAAHVQAHVQVEPVVARVASVQQFMAVPVAPAAKPDNTSCNPPSSCAVSKHMLTASIAVPGQACSRPHC